MTIVMSSPLAGAEMTTFLAPPTRWDLASSAFVNRPVDSTTTSAPTEAQSSLLGSRSSKTRIVLPSTVMDSSSKVTSPGKRPRIESYLSR